MTVINFKRENQCPPPPNLALNFFHQKTAKGLSNLVETALKFKHYQPQFFSVTFGAGGSSRDLTLAAVLAVRDATGIDTAPHISCIGSSKADISNLLEQYQKNNINRLVVLRGDMPADTKGHKGELRYANELVEFIREQTGNHFHIHVAAYPEYHPESSSPAKDFKHFKNKAASGANEAITQYFYNPDSFFELSDGCLEQGVSIDITPGIMPITNYKQLARFSDACGAEIPKWIRQKLAHFDSKNDNIGLQEFGEHAVTMLCETLLNNGAPGLHFYTLNKFEPTHHILQNLLLSRAQA